MIAYRDVVCEVGTAQELGRLLAFADRHETEDLLIGAGELEQAITDALHPDIDVWDSLQARLRALVCAAASAHLDVGEGADAELDRTRSLLEELELGRGRLLPSVTIKAPEGYMHYGLDPRSYAASAASYASAVGRVRARRACIIGVRSIGTSLSAVVAAELGSTRSVTVRPRGRPGERRVDAGASLRARVVGVERDADVLIVDEGPGATGETFECVAAWVASLGIDEARIVLLPHHEHGLALAPDGRRSWFARVRKHLPPREDDAAAEAAAALGLELTDDLSAGRWRALVPRSSTLPCCPHHERRKHRARGPDGRAYLLRYAGRGRWGRSIVERAMELAQLGVGPELHGAARGFVATWWIEGRPVSRAEARGADFRAAVCAYLVARAGRFPTGASVDPSGLRALMLENVCELLGPNPPGLREALRELAKLPPGPATIADARLQVHEWLRTPSGYVKTDALDHGDGIRPPGPIDPAWDLAGAAVEHGLDPATVAALCSRSAPGCGRSPGALAAAVAAYRVPYTACCLGEMTLSAREAAAPSDRQHLRRAAEHYARELGRELARLHGQPAT